MIINLAFYHFFKIQEKIEDTRQEFKALCAKLNLKGTILIAPEGLNIMVAGSQECIDSFKTYLEELIGSKELVFKESESDYQPFGKMFVKVKKQLIPVNDKGIDPENLTAPRISPAELKKWMDEKRDFVLIDTRNQFEVELGTFEGAVDPKLNTFRHFEETMNNFPEEWKNKEVVAFCTGGIRCEKATPLMMKNGYKKVHQLDGGILNYFKEVGSEHYKGDCFVFDERMAINPELKEVEKVLCDSCGNVVTKKEQMLSSYQTRMSCKHCSSKTKQN